MNIRFFSIVPGVMLVGLLMVSTSAFALLDANCGNKACLEGLLNPVTCECVTGLPTLPDTPLDPDVDITEEECIQLNGASTWQTYSLDSTKKYREAHSWITNKCTSRHVAACADNYYGTQYASNTESGAIAGVTCTPCPDGGKSVGPVGILSAPNTSITSCYLPANTTYTGPSGTYTYTDECYYK